MLRDKKICVENFMNIELTKPFLRSLNESQSNASCSKVSSSELENV